MIYDYLFYKSYQLAKKSKNWEDTPILLGVMIVGSCLIFNIGTIICLVDGMGFVKYSGFDNKYRYIVGAIVTLCVGIYYSRKNIYMKILERYERKRQGKNNLLPIVVVLFYCIVSILLLVLSAMYKNGDGFFAND